MCVAMITEQDADDAGRELYDLGMDALEAGVGADAVEYQRRLFAGADLLRRMRCHDDLVETVEIWGERLRKALRERGMDRLQQITEEVARG